MRQITLAFATVAAALMALLPSDAKPDKGGEAKKQYEPELVALQGIWEQTSLERDGEKIESTDREKFLWDKQVWVVAGNRLYAAQTGGVGVVVRVNEIRVAAGGRPAALDFVDVDTNTTLRALLDIKPFSFVSCINCVGKTLRRPEKIAATEQNQVAVFQGMGRPVFTPGYQKNRKPLAGAWRTVEVEHDGERFDRRTKDPEKRHNFWCQQRFFYFQDDLYVMCSAVDGKMAAEYLAYQLGNGKDPRAIDFLKMPPPNENVGHALAAIYKLQDNRLTLCWNKEDRQARPDEFGTVKGDGRLLLRLERVDTDK